MLIMPLSKKYRKRVKNIKKSISDNGMINFGYTNVQQTGYSFHSSPPPYNHTYNILYVEVSVIKVYHWLYGDV